MKSTQDKRPNGIDLGGTVFTFSAFLLWGLLPIYWKALHATPAIEILAHRIWWAFIFVGVYLAFGRKTSVVKEVFQNRYKTINVLLRSGLLACNWFVYTWAVSTNQVVEASLGYYINPLLNVLLAIIFLKERLKKLQRISFALALAGVVVMTFQYGRVPWIALVLASSFGTYGFLKKKAPMDSSAEMFSEMGILAPLALFLIISRGITGNGALLSGGTLNTLLLVGSGIVTALPLIFFGYGAKRIPLIAVGFIQYITPTMMLLLGVVIYHEPFSLLSIIGFSFIWVGLAIFTISETFKI